MTELREMLDAEAHRIQGRPDVLPDVLRRVERRRRGRRIGTAALALLMAAGGMVGAFSAFGRPGSEAGPGARGYAAASPSGSGALAPDAVGTLAMEFIEARSESRAVARYLSAGALRDYVDHEGGLSLYGYAADAHTVSLWGMTEAAAGWRVVIGFQGPEPTFPGGEVIRETLLIGPGRNVLDETVDWVVLAAEPCVEPSRCGGE